MIDYAESGQFLETGFCNPRSFTNFATFQKNMDTVRIHDKEFRVSISAEVISRRIAELGKQISTDMEGKTPLFVAVLKIGRAHV